MKNLKTKNMVLEIVDIEFKELKKDLKKGDEIIEETSPGGKVIKHSKKVGDARVAFTNLMQGLLKSGSIDIKEMGEAIREFGKKTTKLYWIK